MVRDIIIINIKLLRHSYVSLITVLNRFNMQTSNFSRRITLGLGMPVYEAGYPSLDGISFAVPSYISLYPFASCD
jgi:hypothetical protein